MQQVRRPAGLGVVQRQRDSLGVAALERPLSRVEEEVALQLLGLGAVAFIAAVGQNGLDVARELGLPFVLGRRGGGLFGADAEMRQKH